MLLLLMENSFNLLKGLRGVLVLLKFYWAPDIVKFVLGRFSHFNIAIAYSNSTFCGAWTPSFWEFTWKLSKFQQNEHTPALFAATVHHQKVERASPLVLDLSIYLYEGLASVCSNRSSLQNRNSVSFGSPPVHQLAERTHIDQWQQIIITK